MPAVAKFNHIQGLLAREQLDPDVAEVLSASTDGCDVYIGDGDPPPPEEIQEVFNGKTTAGRGAGSLSPRKAMAPMGFYRAVTYQQRLRGSLQTYSASSFPPNEIHRFLKACGLDATYSATPTPQWLYTPIAPNTNPTILTLGDLRQQDRYDLRNVVGTLKIESTEGGAALISFEMRGIHEGVSNVVHPAITIGAHGVQPPHCAGMVLEFDDVTFAGVLRKFVFTQNLVWEPNRTGINLAGLHGGWVIGSNAPTLELELERPARASYNPEALRAAATSQKVALQLGATQYNRAKLTLPQAQVGAPPTPGASGSTATVMVRYDAHASTPNLTDTFSLLMN